MLRSYHFSKGLAPGSYWTSLKVNNSLLWVKPNKSLAPVLLNARATLGKTPTREHVARRLLHCFQDITLHIKMTTIVKKKLYKSKLYDYHLNDLFLRLLIILTLEYFSKQVKIAWNWSLIPRIKKDLNWDILVFKVTIIRRSTTSPIFIKLVSPNNKHKYEINVVCCVGRVEIQIEI